MIFPEKILINGYVYEKDYEHEAGGCYYHSKDNTSPVDGCFISLYPDGHLTYLWNSIEKPYNHEWKTID